MTKKITLEDIRNALVLIKQERPPDKLIDCGWGFITLDSSGYTKTIQLKKETMKVLKSIFYEAIPRNIDFNTTTFEGIPIIVAKPIKELK